MLPNFVPPSHRDYYDMILKHVVQLHNIQPSVAFSLYYVTLGAL